MEVFKKKLRVKYRNAQTQLEWNERLEDVFTDRKVTDTTIEEIDKFATKNDSEVELHDLEERYFRVFQENAKDHCPIFDPTATYEVSEVVQYRLPSEIKVLHSLNSANGFVELDKLERCFWMCTRKVNGQTPSDKGVEIDYDKDYAEYIAKYNLALEQITADSLKLGKTPSIDWSWTDWGWKVNQDHDYIAGDDKKFALYQHHAKKLAVASGEARVNGHYPGNRHWVCLHFDGTGSYDAETDTLVVNHQQIWLARAKILSQVINSYGNLLNNVKSYDRDGPYGKMNLMGHGLRRIFTQEAGAIDTIQKYTRDLEDISAFTIDKSMDMELAKDPRVNSDMSDSLNRWQFFYTEDFMRKLSSGDSSSKWSQHDMWGYDYHIDALGHKIYTDKCFNILTAIMKNQSHHEAEIFLRREEPRDPDFPDRILPSPNEHWEKRRNYWNGIFEQFHGQVEGWWDRRKEKYHYGIEYFLKTLTETANKITPENRKDWEITPDEMDFRRHLQTAVLWNNGRRAGIGESTWHPSVHIVRIFVQRGMHYIIQEQKDRQEQRARANDMVDQMGSSPDEAYRKMVRTIIKYIKPGLWLIEETLQHFYSGRELYSLHRDRDGKRVRVGEHDLKDWGKFNKQLLFKLLMLEGLCVQRGWLSDDNALHRDFHKVARAWQTNGNQKGTWGQRNMGRDGSGYGASWITRHSFQRIWPQNEAVVDLDKYKWLFNVIFTKYDNPKDWVGVGMYSPQFMLRVKTDDGMAITHRINPAEERDYPWLHHEYLRPLRNDESNKWFNIQIKRHRGDRTKYEYIMYIHKTYMRTYRLWSPRFKDKWPSQMGGKDAELAATVYSKVMQLRREHIGFVKGYLPTHRIWHHPQYGCLAFGRLIETTKDTATYKKFMFHVVAHAVEVNKSDVVGDEWIGSPPAGEAPSDKQSLSIFQWQVNGFSDDDMVASWLSENKGLFWRTMWKSPFVDIGADMISDATLEELRKGYERTKKIIKNELKVWDQKIEEGKDLSKNLEMEKGNLDKLKAHMRALERSIKSLEDRLETNRREKELAAAATKDKLTKEE